MSHGEAIKSNPAEILRYVDVRPICRDERPLWDDLIRRYHYLGLNWLVGESIRYVAAFERQWLALLGWSAAALKCKVRDRWIGWPCHIQWQQLALVVNNARFLILPDVHVPNLASHILSLNLRRLSQDWQTFYGHPVWLAETFVDPRYFQGTCYKATGWTFLGHTRGFSKCASKYTHHDHPKMVFVRSLDPNAKGKLSAPYLKTRLNKEIRPMRLSTKHAEDLMDRLSKIPDHRMPRGVRHLKISVLAISICAILSDAHHFAAIAEWAKRCTQNMLKRLGCRRNPRTNLYEPPSEPTIRRFLQKADGDAVDKSICGWLQSLAGKESPVAVDGKTLRGARQENGRQVHLLSAFLHDKGIVLAQRQVDSKTNEITTVPALLDNLDLEGRVVTLDAMHTQKETARYLVEEKRADYLLTVKDNQPTLKKDIEDLSLVDFPPQRQTLEKGHGRLEIRNIRTSTELNDYLDFPYVGQALCICREVLDLKTNKERKETVYVITSLSPEKADPSRLLELNRGHWSIENRLHYVRDVTFNEDRSQIRTDHAPRLMAAFRNLAISLLNWFGCRNKAKTLREMATKPHLALSMLRL